PVREMVRRALAKRPDERYQSFSPVIHELRAVLLDISQRRSRSREPLPSEEIWDEAEENTVKALLAVGATPPEDPTPLAFPEPLADPNDVTPILPAEPPALEALTPTPQPAAKRVPASEEPTTPPQDLPSQAEETEGGEQSGVTQPLALPEES